MILLLPTKKLDENYFRKARGFTKWQERHVKIIAKELKQAHAEFSKTQKELMMTVSEQEGRSTTANSRKPGYQSSLKHQTIT